MKKLLFILMLLPMVVFGQRVDYEDDALFSDLADVLAIPRWKCAVSPDNPNKMWAMSGDSIWYSSDSGITWGTRLHIPSGQREYHNSMSPLNDSVGFMLVGAAGLSMSTMVDADTNWSTTTIANTNGNARGVIIGDTVGDVFWVVGREFNTSPENGWALWTDDAGATWTTESFSDFTDPGYMRVGGFQWYNGVILFIYDSTGDGVTASDAFKYYYADTANGVTAANDSLIGYAYDQGTRGINRAFTMNGLYNDDDTLLMFAWGSDNDLICKWQHEASGTWDSIKVVSNGGESWTTWRPLITVQNDALVLYYIDADTVWAKIFNPDDSTFGARQLISGGHSDVITFNLPQHCQGKNGVATIGTTALGEGEAGNVYNYRTWATDYDTVASALPMTITSAMSGSPSDRYLIGLHPELTSLHSDDGVFVINSGADDFEINLQTDTAFWNEDGSLNQIGIYFTGTNDNILIDSGFYVHNPPGASIDSTIDLNADAFSIPGSAFNITVSNGYYEVNGRSAQIVYMSGAYNINFRSNIWNNLSTALDRRDYWGDHAMLVFENLNSRSQGGFTHHVAIDRCSTLAANWVNYYFHGSLTEASLDSSYIFMDAINKSPYNPPVGIPAFSAEQCYAVGIRSGTAAHVQITNNNFRSGIEHAGSEGVFVTGRGEDTTVTESIYIYNNNFQITKGYAGEFNTAVIIKVRETIQNCIIRKNVIRTTGDTDGSDSSKCDFVEGIRLEQTDNADPKIIVDSNDVRVTFEDLTHTANLVNSINSTGAVGINLSLFWPPHRGGSGSLDSAGVQGIRIRDNKVVAGTAPYTFGQDYNQEQTSWARIVGDTLSFGDSTTTNHWTAFLINSATADSSWGNAFVDCVFDTATGAKPDSIGMSKSGSGDLHTDIQVRSTLNIFVDSTSLPCVACSVYVDNAYGQEVLPLTATGVDGEVSVEATWYREYAHPSVVDSSGFNNMTIVARKGEDSTVSVFTLGFLPASKNDTLAISFAGTPTPAVITRTGTTSSTGTVVIP